LRHLCILLVCVVSLFVNACSSSNTNNSHTESIGYTPSDTDIVNGISGDIKNETRLKGFIQNIEIGQKDNVRVVSYTKEGDPILTDITFNGGQLEVTRDNTRDEHGSNEIKTFNCEKIILEEKKYLITGCEGYEIPYFLAENYN
jgi:hypothetical protein